MEAYCMKCKGKQTMSNPQQITMKNGRPATQGTCPKWELRCSRLVKLHSSYLYIFYIKSKLQKDRKFFLQFCLKEEINYGE
ncbi:MAG: hypothetical protein Ct9H90mP2_15840 [Dehalococcoidia bacterium]|nr:MAG: hypothetical protein Ct9H90mP2_15840 [Dehalococcoidia bacterium]